MRVFPILTAVIGFEFAISIVDVVARTWPGAILSLAAATLVCYLIGERLYSFVTQGE